MKRINPNNNKFHTGAKDGKHYWLTPPKLYEELNNEFHFDFDPAPYPKPDGFNGLMVEWGQSNYVNPPFGSFIQDGKKKGVTAWARKAIEENEKGKRVVLVYPIDKWVLMILKAGAEIRNLGDIKWIAIEDGSQGKGTGRHIACFILNPKSLIAWTSWYCLIKNCNAIIYNTNMGSREEIEKHLKIHGLKEI